jgi:hypothetical protein
MTDLAETGFGLPTLLVGGVLIITMATLILHLLFPPAIGSKQRRGLRLKMRTRCPLCHHALDKEERQGILIEVCPRCQGVWLSQGTLDQILS